MRGGVLPLRGEEHPVRDEELMIKGGAPPARNRKLPLREVEILVRKEELDKK